MVNKQYTIQHKFSGKSPSGGISGGGGKRYSPPPIRNLSIISDTPNPIQNSLITSENKICEKSEVFGGGHQKHLDSIIEEQKQNVFGRNITFYNREFNNDQSFVDRDIKINKSSDDQHKQYHSQRFPVKDLSINDIGRFQYILQMDKEMGTHPDSLYRIPSRIQQTPSNRSSINSSNHVNFWKAGSESPITSTSMKDSRRHDRHHEIIRLFKDFWKYAKWPLLLILCCILLGTLIYFLIAAGRTTTTTTENLLKRNSSRSEEIESRLLQSHGFKENHVNRDNTIKEKDVLSIYVPNVKMISTTERSMTTERSTSTEKLSTTTLLNTLITNITEKIFKNVSTENVTTSTESVLTQKTAPTTLIPFRNTQILKISSQDGVKFDEDLIISTTEKLNNDKKVIGPTKDTLQIIGFTSGHQNNFGVPIEEDERILKILNDELINNNNENETSLLPDKSTTDASIYRTRVSPTLPVIFHGESTTENTAERLNATDVGICESTSLTICRGTLHYDLTTSKTKKILTPLELEHFKYLIDSKCSVRAAEFVCSALEPECRPTQMGILEPCKRICKSILEPCASIIASSEILTMTFDCDSYPDSSDRNVCEDPTRRGQCHDSEFKCLDSTCIPHQWKCDNIKDCSLGEDEDNCMFCEHEEFRCQSNDKCIPDKWRCDQYNDCPDGSDELDCYDYEDDGQSTGADYSGGPRIYSFASIQSPNSPNSRPYLTISSEDRLTDEEKQTYENIGGDGFLPTAAENVEYLNENQTNDALHDENEEIQNGEASGRVVIGIPKNLANFQDSKEIMMTSDSETDYKYSKQNLTRATTAAPTSSSSEKIVLQSSEFCPENQLRCISGKCITVTQICDMIIDCPDGADEAMCVYKN